MYFKITAQPIHADGSVGFEGRNPLHEHGVSLTETMMLMANTMLDYLHVGAWDITVTVDDPQLASAAPDTTAERRVVDKNGDALGVGVLVYKSAGSALAVVQTVDDASILIKYIYSVGNNRAGNLEVLPIIDGKCVGLERGKGQSRLACVNVFHDEINCEHLPFDKRCLPCQIQARRSDGGVVAP